VVEVRSRGTAQDQQVVECSGMGREVDEEVVVAVVVVVDDDEDRWRRKEVIGEARQDEAGRTRVRRIGADEENEGRGAAREARRKSDLVACMAGGLQVDGGRVG
jgi:hypothetical protein